MVHIEDATNITLAFDEFRPSSQELKEVLSKCVSYYDLSLDKIDPEIFNVDDNFYVLSKQGNQYVVLFYGWIDREPIFFTIEDDSISSWSDYRILNFVLNFANQHPGKRLTQFDFRDHCKLSDMETLIWRYRSVISQFIDTTVSEDKKNLLYRAQMQAFFQCLYNYDFSANIPSKSILYVAEELPCIKEEQDTHAHYEL